MNVITRAQAKRLHSQSSEQQPQKRAKLHGRTVSAPPQPSFGWRFLTITGICLLALGLLFVPVAAAIPQKCVGDQCPSVPPTCVGEQCHQVIPYVSQEVCPPKCVGDPCCIPAAVRPQFSKNLAQYMVKGYRLTSDGRGACRLKNPPDQHQQCEDLVEEEIVYSEFASQMTEAITGFKVSDLPTYNEKGNPGVHEGVMIELNPQRMLNFQNALTYAEKNILQDASFFTRSDESILDVVKTIHQIAMKDILPKAGVFRDNVLVVANTDDMRNLMAGALRKIKQIGTRDEVNLIRESIPKLYVDLDAGIRGLTFDQRRAWDKVLFISPMPEQVEPEMLQFVHQLKRHHAEGMSATQLACFAHNEIGRIHAFEDGNGRLGLIMLNSLLKRAGLTEVVIPNDSDYTRKVMEEWKNPGAFCHYIEKRAIPWTNAHRATLELDDTV